MAIVSEPNPAPEGAAGYHGAVSQYKRRLIERTGSKLSNGLYAPPTPAAVAALESADLVPLQFSRSKADYVIATARLIVDGKLDLDALRAMSATRAERSLLAIRGLGPWSVNYLMMRALKGSSGPLARQSCANTFRFLSALQIHCSELRFPSIP